MSNSNNIQTKETNASLEQSSISKFNLDLGEELNYGENPLLKRLSFWYDDTTTQIYKYFVHHPLLGYSLKRIFYGLAMLVATIIIVFFLIRFVTDDAQYIPEYINRIMPGHDHVGDPQYDAFVAARLKMFGVSGSLGEQLGAYLKNLTPFIPKHIHTYTSYDLDLVIDPSANLSQNQIDALQAIINAVKIDNSSLGMFSTLNLGNHGIFLEGQGYKIILDNVQEHSKTMWVYLGVIYTNQLGAPGIDNINDLFGRAIPYSFAFGAISVTVSYLIGVPLGIFAARFKGRKQDSFINGINIVLIAVPVTVIVIGISLLSSKVFHNSMIFASGSFWTKFWPVIALVFMITPTIVIYTRRYVIDEMTSDYTKFAYAKGMGSNKVYYVHIFRNAGIRIIKQFPIDLGFTLFGASILTETQWMIPGMSVNILTAVEAKDSFVILGFIAFASFIQIFSSLLSDLMMVWLDPRVSLGKK